MIGTVIDLDLLEKGESENPFEGLISKIERLFLKGNISFDKTQMEKTILFLERKCQDFSDTDKSKSKLILEAVNANILLFEESDQDAINTVNENLNKLMGMSERMNSSDNIDYTKLFISNIIKHDNPDKTKYTTMHLQEAYNKILVNFNTELRISEKEEWIIEFNFRTTKEENHKPLEFIHTFIEGLNSIEGVKIILEDIKIGSITAKLKAVFDDVKSKEEVKEILESAKMFAKGKLEREYYEVEKCKSEARKNEIEANLLKESLGSLQSNETKEIRKLEMESLKFDNERKKLENEKLKIQLFKEKKELLKEMLSEGIIDQRNFDMLIKGIPFLKIENGHLAIGENIDVIDDL